MNRRFPKVLLALGVFPLLGTPGHSQDFPAPANPAEILREFDQAASGSTVKNQGRRSAAISRIQASSGSGSAAVEFYVTALENTKYRENHQDFMDWRSKNQEALRNSSLQNAAMLQLRYLLLALQRSEKNDAFAQVPECLAYLNSLSGQPDSTSDAQTAFTPTPQRKKGSKGGDSSGDKLSLESKTFLKQPLGDSAVVEWMQIDDLLPEGDDFEASAGNYKGILEKNVRVPLRTKNDPRLPGTWDMQIAMETAATNATKSQQQADAFNQTRIPELLFKKAQDTAAIGQPNRAIDEIRKLVRGYPGTPSVKEWIQYALGLLKNAPAQVAPKGSPVSPETNPASPSPVAAPVTSTTATPAVSPVANPPVQ